LCDLEKFEDSVCPMFNPALLDFLISKTDNTLD